MVLAGNAFEIVSIISWRVRFCALRTPAGTSVEQETTKARETTRTASLIDAKFIVKIAPAFQAFCAASVQFPPPLVAKLVEPNLLASRTRSLDLARANLDITVPGGQLRIDEISW